MRSLLLPFLLMLYTIQLKAQQEPDEKTTITLAALYSSDISYYGQATSEKFPYVLLNATVKLPLGLYFSAGSYKLLNYGSGLSATDLGAGFDYDVNDELNLDLSYSYSLFPANSPLLQASNQNNVNLSAAYSWPWLKSTLSTDYAFGKQSDIFVGLSNSREISLGSLFNEKNAIYMEPAIELVAGTRRFYETYTVAKGKRDKAKGKAPSSPGNSGSAAVSTETVEYSRFNMLSYNFKIPVGLSRGNYIAEFSYQFSVLNSKENAELKPRLSIFGLSCYYQF
ncbi:MipA/OmpV family protein [Arcticibacter tournemirensis]|uniref:MipA/OmpV family protein n=1 Tax=Arcticibacter tournemirensis TaxID=699437 RepID=A0A5M9GVH1_9SPHI|nr:MipA/OmpV family protein [Arcticibacter tournemirensis]KAA8476804.1 MipA/OmpV family protein [Arcticibacter tournemirensis]